MGVPLIFGSGGSPLARKEAPTPQAIGRQNRPSDDNSTRSTGFGNAEKGGQGPSYARTGGRGYHALKKLVGGWEYLSFLGAVGATPGWHGGGTPSGPGIASVSPVKKF